MITKQKLKEYIEKFPDCLSIDEVIDRLVFIEKLEKRIQESEKGTALSEDQLKDEMKNWWEYGG
jgi:flagellar biosynthesis chaperone FliJ